jgi:steroid 5-alpha reductase family enzyme
VSPFAVTLAATAVAFAALWLWSVRIRDVSIVDVYRGPGFAVVVAAAFAAGEGTDPRRLLVAILVAVWGLRLGAHLAWRKRGHGEDFRYAAMRKRHGEAFPRVSAVTVFGLQALLTPAARGPVSGRR